MGMARKRTLYLNDMKGVQRLFDELQGPLINLLRGAKSVKNSGSFDRQSTVATIERLEGIIEGIDINLRSIGTALTINKERAEKVEPAFNALTAIKSVEERLLDFECGRKELKRAIEYETELERLGKPIPLGGIGEDEFPLSEDAERLARRGYLKRPPWLSRHFKRIHEKAANGLIDDTHLLVVQLHVFQKEMKIEAKSIIDLILDKNLVKPTRVLSPITWHGTDSDLAYILHNLKEKNLIFPNVGDKPFFEEMQSYFVRTNGQQIKNLRNLVGQVKNSKKGPRFTLEENLPQKKTL